MWWSKKDREAILREQRKNRMKYRTKMAEKNAKAKKDKGGKRKK